MAVATLRLPRKATLLAASAIFLAGHVLAALAPSYETLMVARVVSAVATGAYWSVAAVVAVRISPAGTTAAFQSAMFAAFSYFAPLLTDVAGLDEDDVPLVLGIAVVAWDQERRHERALAPGAPDVPATPPAVGCGT